jgi:glycosyltransferase involved in cell wall biosynthesis
VQTIVDAFELIADELADVDLVIKHLGSAPPPVEIRRPERTHVVGHVPASALPDYYRACDVCVSMASSDSAPRSVLEAMACGCPCVVSDLPWVHELLEPGSDVVTTEIDPRAVADALRRILTDPDGAQALAARGRSRIEADHDREAQFAHLADVYRAVIDGR